MPKLVLTALIALTAAGPALAAARDFPVAGFDRVRSTVPFDVFVRTGGRPSVHADGPQDALDRLKIEVRGGELTVGTTPGSWWRGWRMGRQKMRIDITVPMLNGASLSGPGNLTVDHARARDFTVALSGPGNLNIGQLEADHAELRLSGPGDLTVAGHAATATMNLSGPGDIRAAGLALRDATVRLSGPGDISVRASGLVRGALSGPGDITVAGGARCAITKSGPGDVHCR